MKEDFMHYVWLYKKFNFSNLVTQQGQSVTIIHSGNYLQNSGPDFFNAQLIIGNQKWAGTVEMHVKSSDWYVHQHETDDQYNNVILHVVWEHDAPIFRKDASEIPVLELKKYVDSGELHRYESLLTPKTWIYCENQIRQVANFIFSNWQERLFFERLERKSIVIQELLRQTDNDWEAVLFCLLAKNFGLNTNGEAFLKIAQSISFSVIRKESVELTYLEALLFGQANLIPENAEDNYAKELFSWYDYLKIKYKIKSALFEPVEFFKHRPDNFPTIRLAQLSTLYHVQRNLFSKISEENSIATIYKLFDVSVSMYWKTHYNFDRESPKKEKKLSKAFIDLLIINTIIPIQFAYAAHQGKEISEQLIYIISQLPAEKNAIIDKFNAFGIPSHNGFESQTLLQLKKEYCNHKRCLQCAIGIELVKN